MGALAALGKPAPAGGDGAAARHPEPGPYERHLDNAATGGAPWLRALVACLCGLFGLPAYDGAAVLVAASVAGAVTLTACAQAVLRRAAPPWLLAANAIVAVALGLSQMYLGAQPETGWIVATANVATITSGFEWSNRRRVGYGIAALTVAGYIVGCALGGGGLPAGSSIRMVLQALLGWTALYLIRRAARLFDALERRAARQRSAAAVARAQRAADRAYLAMLHDTASTTFLMVSTGATDDVDWLPTQAAHDLELLTAQTTSAPEIDLADLLDSLAGYEGLDLRLDVHGPLLLPSEPALAIYHGVREALRNVRRHAGDAGPVLSADLDGERVAVTVADRGVGFQPDQVPPHRHGLSHSILARMAAAGGEASVDSVPGKGTTVQWTWSRG